MVCVSVFAMHQAHAALKEVPTYERDYADFKDEYVPRGGPQELRRASPYKTGQLGVLLPTYDRKSLFLAFRALTLGRTAAEKQTAETQALPVEQDQILGNVNTWLEARRAVTDTALSRDIEQNHSFDGRAYGKYLNCGDSAFNYAAETLQALSRNTKLSKRDVQQWVTAQDAVFDQCGDRAAGATAAAVPQELPSGAPLVLRQLRQYQVAAAHFYSGQFAHAVRRFDAIAADKAHPMRAWASQSAMRALLRSASLDHALDRRARELADSQDSSANKAAAFKLAYDDNQHKMADAYAQIATRANAIQADQSLASIHQPARRLVLQAALMIVPERVYQDLSAALGRFDKDVDTTGELIDWSLLGDRLFDYRGHGDLAAALRGQYEYFDWIRTIQSCTDNPQSPNFTGRCDQEQVHAQQQWSEKKNSAWLVAVLMTAQKITPNLESALAAAKQVGRTNMEYFTLRYYMVKLLRGAGRWDEARAIVEQVLDQPGKAISADLLKNATAAENLFKQEGLALAINDQQALPYLLRKTGGVRWSYGLGADGDELLNRQMASEDLLRLARLPSIDSGLRKQLLLASLWRADLTGNRRVADNAMRAIADLEPGLNDFARSLAAVSDPEGRQVFWAGVALTLRISPQVFKIGKDFGTRLPGVGSLNNWCSFDSNDFKAQARVQRVPSQLPQLAADARARDAEMAALRKIGSSVDWVAAVAAQRAKTKPNDAGARTLLTEVVKADNPACSGPDSESLIAAAKQALASMAPLRPISEAEVRVLYDREKQRTDGKQEYHVAHIMFSSEADANATWDRVRNGARFEEEAKRSADPGSSAKGGDLGWSFSDSYAPPFADAVRSMTAPGLYPRPVKTQFGWHVIRVLGVRPYSMPSFEKARPYIEQTIRKQEAK